MNLETFYSWCHDEELDRGRAENRGKVKEKGIGICVGFKDGCGVISEFSEDVAIGGG